MADVDDFLESVLPRLRAADWALVNGDASERIALWSHTDPVTLFGAAATRTGWNEIEPVFAWLASDMSNCSSFEIEVLAAGASCDLAYVVALEHVTASLGGNDPTSFSLRVTTVFRREEGRWRPVHRHGDPYDAGAANTIARHRQRAPRPTESG